MSLYAARKGLAGRLGELALWTGAAVFVLSVHVGGAAYLMQQDAEAPAESGPPAAIMIDMAPEPVAANTEEDQISEQTVDQEEVKTEQIEPVEEPADEPPPQPVVDPVEEPPVETPPEEVVEAPEPPPEPIVEPLPVEKVDPIENKVMAALENVEVPLPMTRPPAPVRKEAPKPRPQKQAQKEMAEAKLQTKESDRTAATQTSAGTTFSSLSPSTWKSKVQARLARNARRCPGNGTGTAAVRFSFDNGGTVTNVSLSRSSGNPEIDDYIVSVVHRSSPIPAPPAGVPSYLVQALTCSR